MCFGILAAGLALWTPLGASAQTGTGSPEPSDFEARFQGEQGGAPFFTRSEATAWPLPILDSPALADPADQAAPASPESQHAADAAPPSGTLTETFAQFAPDTPSAAAPPFEPDLRSASAAPPASASPSIAEARSAPDAQPAPEPAATGSVPRESPIGQGMAVWYGFPGKTASGEMFNPEGFTAGHRTLPFGTRVRVVDVNSGRSVIVRINDRGPKQTKFVIDLSRGSARALGISGVGNVALYRIEERAARPPQGRPAKP